MKQKLIVFATVLILLSSLSFSISAQNSTEKNAGEDNTKNKSSVYHMNDMWYVSVGAGPNILIASQDANMPSFGDRIKFGGEFSVGKWITPILGARAQFYMGEYQGFNYCKPQLGRFTASKHDKGYFPMGWPEKVKRTSDESGFYQKFTSSSVFLDFTLNFTRLFTKTLEPKHFDAIGYLGVGYLHNQESKTNPTTDCIGGRFGGRLNYNVVKGGPWAIYLEGNGTFLPEKYDGYIGGRGFDANANVLIGVQYTFKK